MKRLSFFIIASILFSLSSYAQCGDWMSFIPEVPYGYGVATDENANIYSGSTFYDDIVIEGQLIDVTPGNYFYVCKYDKYGQLIWIRYFESSEILYIYVPMLTYKNDRVFVAAAFGSELLDEGGNLLFSNPGFYTACVLDLDAADGVKIDEAYFTSDNATPNYLGIWGITTSQDGTIYITGLFNSNFYLGSFSLNTSGRCAFVAKLDGDLNVLWAQKSSHSSTVASYYARGFDIATDEDENVVISGMTWKDITFGSVTFNTLNDAGWNPYVAKFDSNGNCLWINGGAGPGYFAHAYAVAVDQDKNVYMTSYMDSTTITVSGQQLNAISGRMYTCKFDQNSNLIWLKQTGVEGPDEQLFSEIHLLPGVIWYTGWTAIPFNIGNQEVAAGVFAAKSDEDGNFTEVYSTYGLSYTYKSVIDVSGNLYIHASGNSDSIAFAYYQQAFTDSIPGVSLIKLCKIATGIETNDPAGSILLYPNPSSSSIHLTLPASYPNYYIIKIFSAEGKLVSSQTIFSGEGIIDIQKLAAGLYFIHVSNETSSWVEKFVKE